MKRMVDFIENLLAVIQIKKEKGFPSKTVGCHREVPRYKITIARMMSGQECDS